MKTTFDICDGCKKPIDPKKPSLEFAPLRGGLDLKLKTPEGEAVFTIDRTVHLCGPDCFNLIVADLAKEVEPVETEPAVAPGATAAKK